MDALYLEVIVRELRQSLSGAAIKKIYQPSANELVLRLWNGRENISLLISLAPQQARLHLVTETFPNPPAPPRFCQLLRARLKRLVGIEQPDGERTVVLMFSGDNTEYRLVCELFGSRSNAILVDGEGMIVDAMRRVGHDAKRPVAPGGIYIEQPRLKRMSLDELQPDALARENVRSWLLKNVEPMPEWLADDIVSGVKQKQYFSKIMEMVRTSRLSTTGRPVIETADGQLRLLPWASCYIENVEREMFTTPSLAAEEFYRRCGRDSGSERQQLSQVVNRALKKIDKRCERIDAELNVALDFDRMKELGELLLAAMGRLQRGMKEVELDDWFADPPGKVSVALDPLLLPQENVDRYFKRYRKGKRGIEHMERRLAETAAEREWLLGVQQAIDEAHGATELHPIKQELEDARLLKLPMFGVKKRPPRAKPLTRTTTTPGGLTLHWGMNNHSNDYVTKRLTDADDLWLHVHRQPGCHLVIKCPDGSASVSEEDIFYAAALAAGYSRARHDSKVEVMVAQGRAVSKPKGWRPGLVRVTEYRTLLVAPERLNDDR